MLSTSFEPTKAGTALQIDLGWQSGFAEVFTASIGIEITIEAF